MRRDRNERQEKQQKRENEFDASKNRWNNKCDKQINEISQEWEKVKDLWKLITKEWKVLKKTAEEQKTEGDRLQKLQILLEKTQEKQKCIIVHPRSCSGVPVVQSGFSP
jgi:hypothetical protein